jgi:hypothetical protein
VTLIIAARSGAAITAVESREMTALAYSTDTAISIASTLPGKSGTAVVTVR